MIRLFVDLDVDSVREALTGARAAARHELGVRVGARLLARVGPMAVGAISDLAPVLCDGRIAGGDREMVAAVRGTAAMGPVLLTVDGRVHRGVLDRCVEAAAGYGAEVAALTVPPALHVGKRGSDVSASIRHLGQSDVRWVLGTTSDIGVVAQISDSIGVIVMGVDDPGAVGDAVRRGAAGVVLDVGIGSVGDPVHSISRFVEAIEAADTIEAGGP